MVSRRDVVTGGVIGTLATAGVEPTAAQEGASAQTLRTGLKAIDETLGQVRSAIDQMVQPDLSQGLVGRVRAAYLTHLHATGRFPEFVDVGAGVFLAIYDWHVKHMQQIQIARLAENRMAIQFMFTQLVLRWENQDTYIGTPYDR